MRDQSLIEDFETSLARLDASRIEEILSRSPADRHRQFLLRLKIESLAEGESDPRDFASLNDPYEIYVALLQRLSTGTMPEGAETTLQSLSSRHPLFRSALASFYCSSDRFSEAASICEEMYDAREPSPELSFKARYLLLLMKASVAGPEFHSLQPLGELHRHLLEHRLLQFFPLAHFLEAKIHLARHDEEGAKRGLQSALVQNAHRWQRRLCLPNQRLLHALENYSLPRELENRPQLRTVYLAFQSTSVISREEISRLVWNRPYNPITDEAKVYMLIQRLRASLKSSGTKILNGPKGWEIKPGTNPLERTP